MEPTPFSIATTAGSAGVYFSREERERHLYIVGKSGSGKSTFMFNLAMGDIAAGHGVAVIDPHRDLALDVLDAIPRARINDVCYLDATDTERPVGFNPATMIAPERRALAAAGIVSAFKHLWSDSWGPRLEHFLFHGIAALISRRHATLIDLPRLYTDDLFRERVIERVTDPETRRFWNEEFPSYSKQFRTEAAAPILNKAGQFAASPQLRLILGQLAPRLDLSFATNNRRILVANLAKVLSANKRQTYSGRCSFRICSLSRWSGEGFRPAIVSPFSYTSTNSRRSALMRLLRFCQKLANLRPTSVS